MGGVDRLGGEGTAEDLKEGEGAFMFKGQGLLAPGEGGKCEHRSLLNASPYDGDILLR